MANDSQTNYTTSWHVIVDSLRGAMGIQWHPYLKKGEEGAEKNRTALQMQIVD